MTCCCTALRGVFSQTINFGQDFLRNEYPKGQWGIAWVAISWIAICLAPFYYALRTRAVDRFADAEQGGRRYSAGGPRGGFGLRSFLRLGAALSARAERARFVPEPFVPIGRPWARLDRRSCHRESGQARGARR